MNQIQQAQGQLSQMGQFVAYRDIDPRILVELADIRADIRRLNRRLDELGRGHSDR
jgi:hypothetical protein